jgi:hypothetical protein
MGHSKRQQKDLDHDHETACNWGKNWLMIQKKGFPFQWDDDP